VRRENPSWISGGFIITRQGLRVGTDQALRVSDILSVNLQAADQGRLEPIGRTELYIDALACDFVLKAVKENLNGTAELVLCDWSSFLLKHTKPLITGTKLPIPLSRTRTLKETLVNYWASKNEEEELPQQINSTAPQHQDPNPEDFDALPKDSHTPKVHKLLPKSKLIKAPIRIPLEDTQVKEAYQHILRDEINIKNTPLKMAIEVATRTISTELGLGARPIGRGGKKIDSRSPKTNKLTTRAVDEVLKVIKSKKGRKDESFWKSKVIGRLKTRSLELRTAIEETRTDTNAWPKKLIRVLLETQARLETEAALTKIEHTHTQKQRIRKEKSRKFELDRPGALREMTKIEVRAQERPLIEKVKTLLDRGRGTILSGAQLAEAAGGKLRLIRLTDSEQQWSTKDLVQGWRSVAPERDYSQEVTDTRMIDQFQPLSDNFDDDWRRKNSTSGHRQLNNRRLHWDLSAEPHINGAHLGAIILPTKPLNFKLIGAGIRLEIEEAIRKHTWIETRNGAALITLRNETIIRELRSHPPKIHTTKPDWTTATDGSGTEEECKGTGHGGFGALLIGSKEIRLIIGGREDTTSGEMEMAAALEAIENIPDKTSQTRALTLSDYKAWTDADLDKTHRNLSRGMKHKKIWHGITSRLADWAKDGDDRGQGLTRAHVNSHKGRIGEWKHTLNEIADILASFGKELAKENEIPQWEPPEPVKAPPIDPKVTEARLAGPITDSEICEGIMEVSSKASDTLGQAICLLKKGGQPIQDAIRRKFNDAIYEGEAPGYGTDDLIIGKCMDLAKEDGGIRSITISDCLGVVFSSIMSKRFIRALLEAQIIDKAQKCNIPGVSGCEANLHIFLMAIYEFRASATSGRLKEGDMRIFLFVDMAKAFDRAQWPAIAQAVRQLFGLPDNKRIAAILKSLYAKARIIVTSGEWAAMVDKLGGVHQGDPLSPILFIILLELVRRQIPHCDRARIKLRLCDKDPFYLRIELDYADDQLRTADGIPKSQRILNSLVKSLKTVGQEYNPKKSRVLAIKYDPRAEGKVAVFDPKLTIEAADGSRTPIEAYTIKNYFKMLGVVTNYKGDFSEAARLALAKEETQRKSTAKTLYPIAAKIDATRQVTSRTSEFLFPNVWFLEKEINRMDTEERKFLRELLHINITNAACEAQLAIALRSKRSQATFLGKFVARLGDADSRVSTLMRYLIEDSAQRFDRVHAGEEKTIPEFFDWTEAPQKNPERDLLKLGLRLQYLAAKWGVGLELEGKEIKVTLSKVDGQGKIFPDTTRPVRDPKALTSLLTKEARARWLEKLTNRISTNPKKKPAPHGSMGWGLASRDTAHQSEMISFFTSTSKFNDTEVRVLVALYYQLWKTALRDAIFSGGQKSARCSKCGAVETASHILNIPEQEYRHSRDLTGIARGRHTEGVTALGWWINNDLGEDEWIVTGEGLTPDPEMEHFRTAINRQLALQGLGEDTQHHKPDIVRAEGKKGSRMVSILDITFGTDGKLIEEEELTALMIRAKMAGSPRELFLSDSFSKNGEISGKGLNLIKEKVGIHEAKLAKAVGQFKQARYMRRYEPYRIAIERAETGCKAEVLTIATGVGAWIPRFTEKNIEKIKKGRRAKDLKARLRLTARIWAVKAWRAWRTEKESGP
jgi:ribonuclease HI